MEYDNARRIIIGRFSVAELRNKTSIVRDVRRRQRRDVTATDVARRVAPPPIFPAFPFAARLAILLGDHFGCSARSSLGLCREDRVGLGRNFGNSTSCGGGYRCSEMRKLWVTESLFG